MHGTLFLMLPKIEIVMGCDIFNNNNCYYKYVDRIDWQR